MTKTLQRPLVEAFYRAFAMHDPARLAPFLHDSVVWIVVGPVDLLPTCGERRGKAAVLELFGTIGPQLFKITNFEPEILIVDKDRSATLARVTGIKDGRVISYRVTQFLRFRGKKVIECRAVLDSYHAVEQVIGRPLSAAEDTELLVNDAPRLVAV
jgi:ketosteroid isomerase-like protein